MEGTPTCANHPERPAARACARCGTFVCSGCVVSRDLCTTCKSRLLREGVPWSPAEKARSAARRCLRGGLWTLRFTLAFGGVAALLTAAEPDLRWLPWIPGALSVALGLATVTLAALGSAWSRRGRPGPAVEGVFPPSVAAMMVVTGLLPLGLALYAVLRAGGG